MELVKNNLKIELCVVTKRKNNYRKLKDIQSWDLSQDPIDFENPVTRKGRKFLINIYIWAPFGL